jgi:hypothetical protein
MTDRFLGFQIVLLDEHGAELKRIPDVYQDDSFIILEARYEFRQTGFEGGQRVRYFQRVMSN